MKYTKAEITKAFSLIEEMRIKLKDPSGLMLFDPELHKKCLKFCNFIEKKLLKEDQSSGS